MGSSVLSSLILSAKRRPAVLNALSNCGLTSRKTTSKTPKTNNFSTLTKRWQRFSETTASVPSVWPSSSPLTCLKLLGEYLFLHTLIHGPKHTSKLGPCVYQNRFYTPTLQKKNLKFTKRKA